MGTLKRLAPALTLVIPLGVALGAQAGTTVLAYFLIGCVAVFLIAVAIGRVPERWYGPCLYSLSLGLMWQASMVGVHIIGSDMHGEFYASSIVLRDGYWDWAREYGTQSSTSFVVGWLVPSLGRIMAIEWVYKAVLPAIFAATPVILYYLFRRLFGAKIAVYSAVFFVIVPVATLEVVQIGKSMVAEVFLALGAYAVCRDWKWCWRTSVLTGCSLLALWAHYTIGLAMLAYLLGIGLTRLASARRVALAVAPLVAVLVSSLAGFYYYRTADNGTIWDVVRRVGIAYSAIAASVIQDTGLPAQISDTYVDERVEKPTQVESVSETKGYSSKFSRQEMIIKTAVGMDFAKADGWGKVFRVVQYLTQVLVLLGAAHLFVRRRKLRIPAEFSYGVACSLALLALVVFLPQFSMIINATRFYHISLFFLAPMLPLGIVWLTKNRWVPVAVLLVYFAFTSGLVFELAKYDRLDRIGMPYSVGLSAERTGVVGTYTAGDVEIARWLAEESDPSYMIVGDYNGWRLVSGFIGLGRLRDDAAAYNPTLDDLPEDRPLYIFLTTWNTEHQRYIESLRDTYGGAGLRAAEPLPDFSQYPIVFETGGAVVHAKR